jgi:hypothetical protein
MKRYVTSVNEFHPGAKSIRESIEFFISAGEDAGIPRETSMLAMEIWLDYYADENVAGIAEKGSLLARAIENMETCIATIEDDGYPLSWILDEMQKMVY